MDLNTSLLREKFLIKDENNNEPLVAVSNRLPIPLHSSDGKVHETFIVRAQTMYHCIRMSAQIIKTFDELGPVSTRDENFDWNEAFDNVMGDFDKHYFADRWVAVYKDGLPVFKNGNVHAFLDIIEKCDYASPDEYNKSILLAEKTFEKLGRNVEIEHDENIGLNVNIGENQAKCGIILRNADKSGTFNFKVDKKADSNTISAYQCLKVCAAYLEGIQLSFIIGQTLNHTENIDDDEKAEKEKRKARRAKERMNKMLAEIQTLENTYSVHYRPEKPDFDKIIADAKSAK